MWFFERGKVNLWQNETIPVRLKENEKDTIKVLSLIDKRLEIFALMLKSLQK